MKHTVVMDIDGVLIPYEGWVKTFNISFGTKYGMEELDLYNMPIGTNWKEDEILSIFADPPANAALEPDIMAVRFLDNIRALYGSHIIIITSRPEGLVQVTRNWLDYWEIEHDYLLCNVKDKGDIVNYKPYFINLGLDEYPPVLFIDDSPLHVSSLAKVVPHGIMMNRVDMDVPGNVIKVDDWYDLSKRLWDNEIKDWLGNGEKRVNREAV